MFCLRLAWLVVAYPMQVNKVSLRPSIFLKIILVYSWKQPEVTNC
jgi:hypothetical protein